MENTKNNVKVKQIPLEEIIGAKKEKLNGVGDIIVSGLLADLKDGVTKDGKPYVSGKVKTKKAELPFKFWDISLPNFLEKYKIPENSAVAVDLFGCVDFYQESPQFITKKMRLSKPETLKKFIQMSRYNPEEVISEIRKIVSEFFSKELSDFCNGILDKYEEKMSYYPYNETYYSYLGGFIDHILGFISVVLGSDEYLGYFSVNDDDDQVTVKKEILIAAILAYRIFAFETLKIDKGTGSIIGDGNYQTAIMGSVEMGSFAIAYKMMAEISGDTLNSFFNEVLACLTGIITNKPSTINACIFKFLIDMELNASVMKKTQALVGEGQVGKVFIGGELCSVVNIDATNKNTSE